MKMILVEWVDSNIIHGWVVPGEGIEDKVAHCQTIGFLKSQDEEKITLAMGKGDLGAVIECITIPKGCVRSIKELRIKGKKKEG